jgi:hypothetical protein
MNKNESSIPKIPYASGLSNLVNTKLLSNFMAAVTP